MDIMNQRISSFYKIGIVKKSTIWAFFSLLLYKLILDISYYLIISKVWNYAKFELHLDVFKLFESYLLFFIIFTLLPKSSKKLSNLMIWLLILLSYIPMLTIFAFKDESRIFMYAVTAFWIMVFLLSQHIYSIILPSLAQFKIILYFIFLSISGIVFFIIYEDLGFSFNFNLMKVYEIRSRYAELVTILGGYLLNWLAYIINPVFFALFLRKRKWFPVALILFSQFLLFSITGNKTFLFSLPFVLVLIWIITRKNALSCMAIGISGAILLGMFSYWLIGDVWISSLFTRRTLFIPSQLSFLYYDFFSKNESVLLSHSVFRFFTDYPYHLNPANLISAVYFNRPEGSANSGIVGDAYMNFGFGGLFLWGILLVIILRLIDSCSKRIDFKVGIAAIAMPTITLTNSGLLTNLLTHGLFLALILLYLLPKEKSRKGVGQKTGCIVARPC